MLFKVAVNAVDGSQTLSLETHTVQVVRTILQQYDHEGAGIFLEIHLEGEDIYKVLHALQEDGLRPKVQNRPQVRAQPAQQMENTLDLDGIFSILPQQNFNSTPRLRRQDKELFSLGAREITCMHCKQNFTIQEDERWDQHVTCPNCDEILDSDDYRAQEKGAE